jgi:hypothetical protein
MKIVLLFIVFYQFDRVFARAKKDQNRFGFMVVVRFHSYWSFESIREAGVKIDYIGGTSMRYWRYASGYNATQIDSIFHQDKFHELTILFPDLKILRKKK